MSAALCNLMTAIRTRLAEELDYVKPANIFIAPDEGYIPDNIGTPAIGIADGGFDGRNDGFGGYNKTFGIVILPTVMLKNNPEAGIMGAGDEKGVIDLAWDIEQALHGYLFRDDVNIIGLQDASLIRQSPSFPIVIKPLSWQRVAMTFEYEYRVCE